MAKKEEKKRSTTKDSGMKPNLEETLAVNLSFEELIKLSVSQNEDSTVDKMNKKRKSINPSYKQLQKDEIRVSIMDIENNRDILIQTISAHIKNSTCENCEWTIHVINESELETFNSNRKDCLLKIFIEKELIGNVIDELKKDFNFIFKKTEQENFFKLVILIYCEQPLIFQ